MGRYYNMKLKLLPTLLEDEYGNEDVENGMKVLEEALKMDDAGLQELSKMHHRLHLVMVLVTAVFGLLVLHLNQMV